MQYLLIILLLVLGIVFWFRYKQPNKISLLKKIIFVTIVISGILTLWNFDSYSSGIPVQWIVESTDSFVGWTARRKHTINTENIRITGLDTQFVKYSYDTVIHGTYPPFLELLSNWIDETRVIGGKIVTKSTLAYPLIYYTKSTTSYRVWDKISLYVNKGKLKEWFIGDTFWIWITEELIFSIFFYWSIFIISTISLIIILVMRIVPKG